MCVVHLQQQFGHTEAIFLEHSDQLLWYVIKENTDQT